MKDKYTSKLLIAIVVAILCVSDVIRMIDKFNNKVTKYASISFKVRHLYNGDVVVPLKFLRYE